MAVVDKEINIRIEICKKCEESKNEIAKEYNEILNHFDNTKIYKTVYPVVKAIQSENSNFFYITHTHKDTQDLRYFKILTKNISFKPSDEELKQIVDKYKVNWLKYKNYGDLLYGWSSGVVDDIVYTGVNLYLDYENSVFNSFHELGHVVDRLDSKLKKIARENMTIKESTCQLFGYKFLMMFTNTKKFEYDGDDYHPYCDYLHEDVLKYPMPKRMTFNDLVKFKL